MLYNGKKLLEAGKMRKKIKKVQSVIGYRADGQAIKKAFYGRTKEAAKAVAEA